jgi:exonuclease SbcC
MLELELLHFGCYYNKTNFTFPDLGLVLLEGVSGAGKSTILRAINFALFGDKRTSLISFNEKSCTVIMKYDGFEITRSKGPNKLLVLHDEEKYDGDSAQEIINQHFGIYFTITSYITQDKEESFFHLSSTARMSFLEKIAIGGIDVTNLKKKCSEKIKERKKKLNERVGELKIVKEEYEKLSKPEEVEFPLGGKYSEVKLKNEEIKRKNNNTKLVKARKELVTLQTQQSQYKIRKQKHDQLQSQITVLEDELKTINKELSCINQKHSIDIIQKRLEYLRINTQLIQLQTAYKNDLQQYKGLCVIEISQFQDTLDELNKIPIIENKITELKSLVTKKQKLIKIDERIKEVEEEIEEYSNIETYSQEIHKLEEKQQALQHEKSLIKERHVRHKCPNCSIFLKFNNSSLELASKETQESLRSEKEIENELKEIKKEILDYITSKHDLEQLRSEHDNLLKQRSNYKDFDLEIDYEKQLDEHNKQIIEQNDRQKHILNLKRKIDNEEYSTTIQALKRKLETRQETISKLEKELKINDVECNLEEKDDIEALNKLLTDCHLTKQKLDILNKQKLTTEEKLKKIQISFNEIKITEEIDYEDKLEDIRINIEEYEKQEKLFIEKRELIDKYLEYKKILDNFEKWEKKFEDAIYLEQKARESLVIAEIVLRKIKETESASTLSVIDNINTHLQYYLDKFFIDPIKVDICAFQETKSGEQKPCINIKVGYKGCECDIESLSGGERSRVELAICLSINNLIGGKLLLLDEVFASLNAESINEIVEVLKTEAHENNKLVICIAHQAIEGEYDHVVSLDN